MEVQGSGVIFGDLATCWIPFAKLCTCAPFACCACGLRCSDWIYSRRSWAGGALDHRRRRRCAPCRPRCKREQCNATQIPTSHRCSVSRVTP